MSPLEEALKLACAKGMTHLTLYPVPSADHKKIYWVARATPSAAYSYQQAEALDPVAAVLEVLKALPKAKVRAAPKKGDQRIENYKPDDIVDDETRPDNWKRKVTAKVTPPEPETFDTWLPKT